MSYAEQERLISIDPDELSALKTDNARLREALARVDLSLRVPAAEYVPAIGDAFKIIDAALNPSPKEEKQ